MKIKDKLSFLPEGSVKMTNCFDDAIKLVIKGLFKNVDFSATADFFRYRKNQFAAGEFWGKLMRAATLLYKYTYDEELLAIIDNAIDDMLTIQAENGCVSTAPDEQQPNGSGGADMWERKYVLLGMLGYYDISGSPSERRSNVLRFMCRLADYTISQVGSEPGKMSITDTGWAFYGIESSSILEPIVKLYHITGEKRYLDFAGHIVSSGACKKENIFEAILAGKDPKDIGGNGKPEESIAKAYEMMSCFEGLIEYYRATGIDKYKKTAMAMYKKLIQQEITLLGSGGADMPYNLGPGNGEQWNYTKFEQTNPNITIMMETCVTVTWLKLCHQLLRLTGDASIADNMEISMYNLLTGALRPDGMFFEYFPRFNGTRNPNVNFSYKVGDIDLSCCTANGPMGLAYVPFTAFMDSPYGIVINFLTTATVEYAGKYTLSLLSLYPSEGNTRICMEKIAPVLKGKSFSVFIRIPAWAKDFKVYVNNRKIEHKIRSGYVGYAEIRRMWKEGDTATVSFDISDHIYFAPRGINPLGQNKAAIMHGPIVLSQDKRTGEDIKAPLILSAEEESNKNSFSGVYREREIELQPCDKALGTLCQFKYKGKTFIDYMTAGSTWDEDSEFVTWMDVTT